MLSQVWENQIRALRNSSVQEDVRAAIEEVLEPLLRLGVEVSRIEVFPLVIGHIVQGLYHLWESGFERAQETVGEWNKP